MGPMSAQSQFASFLLPETVFREDGAGPAVDLAGVQGKTLLLTLGITRIIEQESLDVTVRGSADGSTWSAKPILTFPQKFSCGVYAMSLDLSAVPEARYIRVEWKMSRWGRGELKPLFGFYVFAEETAGVLAAAGG